MSDKLCQQRSEIDQKFKWDIEAMYPDESLWEKDLEECMQEASNFSRFKGKITESAHTLYDARSKRPYFPQAGTCFCLCRNEKR